MEAPARLFSDSGNVIETNIAKMLAGPALSAHHGSASWSHGPARSLMQEANGDNRDCQIQCGFCKPNLKNTEKSSGLSTGTQTLIFTLLSLFLFLLLLFLLLQFRVEETRRSSTKTELPEERTNEAQPNAIPAIPYQVLKQLLVLALSRLSLFRG